MNTKDNLKTASSIASIILSILALIVSIKACEQGRDSLSIQQEAFQSERSLIYKAELMKENNVLRLKPTEEGITIQRIKIYYPTKLKITEWTIKSQSYEIHIEGLKRRLQKLLDQLIIRRKNSIVINDNDWVPIALYTNYIAKGKAYIDISIYYIDYSFGVSELPSEEPFISFSSLVFSKKVDSVSEIDKVLDQEWENCLLKL